MIKFKRYPYRVGETYGMNGGLTKRQITMAVNKPVRQAKKLQQKAPLLAELITAEPIQDFDAKAEYERRHQFYYERLKRERRERLSYENFKQAVKALHIDINMLTKENRNDNKT